MFLSLFSRETHRKIGSIQNIGLIRVNGDIDFRSNEFRVDFPRHFALAPLFRCDSPMIQICFRLIYQLTGDPVHAAKVLGWLNLEGISPRVAILCF